MNFLFRAGVINPDWVRLYQSRGTEGYYHKLFMRYSVLVADLLLFFPALYFVTRIGYKDNREALMIGLLYPGLILIDYGHFQYNNVSLGLLLWAVYFISKNCPVISSICFCLSLNYKQMELYHSIPFFCYLLGDAMKCGVFKG